MNKYRVAAYGTLKVGHGNWSYFFSGCECLVEGDRLRGYELRTWPNGGYPAIFKTGNEDDEVVVDLFDLSTSTSHDPDDLLMDVDGMEYGAGYDKELVTLESGEVAWVYTMDASNDQGMDHVIESGDWNEFTDNRRHG